MRNAIKYCIGILSLVVVVFAIQKLDDNINQKIKLGVQLSTAEELSCTWLIFCEAKIT